jgi:hypothetical protein
MRKLVSDIQRINQTSADEMVCQAVVRRYRKDYRNVGTTTEGLYVGG